MPEISDLKNKINCKTTNMVLLSIATAGIFPILWIYKNNQTIVDITKAKTTDSTFVIWIAVCVGLGGALAGTGDVVLDGIAGVLTIASAVLYVIWAFKTKNAIIQYAANEHRLNFKMNSFYTFAFNVYYINYCINDLPEEKRKQEAFAVNVKTEAQS